MKDTWYSIINSTSTAQKKRVILTNLEVITTLYSIMSSTMLKHWSTHLDRSFINWIEQSWKFDYKLSKNSPLQGDIFYYDISSTSTINRSEFYFSLSIILLLTCDLSSFLYNRVLFVGALGRVSSRKLIDWLPCFTRRLNKALFEISAQSRQILAEFYKNRKRNSNWLCTK